MATALTGVLSASAADYPSDNGAIGTSPSAPWMTSNPAATAVVGDIDRGSVLQLTAQEDSGAQVLHHLASGTFPTVDAAYAEHMTYARFIDGTREPGSTIPYAGGATADVMVTGDAQVFVDVEVSYTNTSDELATTTITCALPATDSWSTIDLAMLCNYDAEDNWLLTSWQTTEDWSYRTSSKEPEYHTYPAGSYISGVSKTPLSAFATAIGFRVEGPAGATARIDQLVVRDSALSFTSTPTTLSFSATTDGVAVPGVTARLSGTVAPSTAAGTLRFFDGGTLVAEGAVVDGVFTATTAELLALPGTIQIPQSSFSFSSSSVNSDGTISGATPLSGEMPWPDDSDSFVDVYAYSSPIYLGTFPVVNGVVQLTGVNLAALSSGGHHLVFIGQTSSTVSIMAIQIRAELAATGGGIEAAVPVGAAGVLLVAGALLLVVRQGRRRRV